MQIEECEEIQCFCGNPIRQDQKNYCQCCLVNQSNKNSQIIKRLRQKLEFYKHQQEELQNLVKLTQKEQNQKLLKPIQNYLKKQIISQALADKQIQQLKKQINAVDKQIQSQLSVQKQQDEQLLKLITEIQQLQNNQLQKQKHFRQLAQFYGMEIRLKQNQLKSFKSMLQTTNFVSLIFSISFEGDDSFLNGQKIIIDNCWLIAQILCFYQNKYPNYHSQLQINLDSMKITPSLKMATEINKKPDMQLKNNKIKQQTYAQPIQISCQDQQQALNSWMPYIIKQTYYLFDFMIKQSGVKTNYKLNYQISANGEFLILKDNNLGFSQRFVLIVKYLLTNINQINKLEYFALQKRVKEGIQKKQKQRTE